MAKDKQRSRLEELQAARSETLEEVAALDAQLADLDRRRAEIEGEASGGDVLTARAGATVAELGEMVNQAAGLRRVRSALTQRQAAIEREIAAVLRELHAAEAHRGHLEERKHFEGDTLPKIRALIASLEELGGIQREIASHYGRPRAAVDPHLAALLARIVKDAPVALAKWADWSATA